MALTYFKQYKESRRFIRLFILFSAVIFQLFIVTTIAYTPDFRYIQFILQIFAFSLVFTSIHFWIVAPLLSKRVGIIYFFVVLVICSTITTCSLLYLVESGIVEYPDIIFPEYLPLRMKIAFYFCCSFLIFFGTRFLYLFLNTFQISDERYKYLNENYVNEINSLKMQSNPLFLLDSINKMSTLIYENHFEAAIKLNSDVSFTLNKQLKYTQKDYIVLQEELDWQKQYLNIYNALLEQKFDFKIFIDDDELLLQPIPPLLLQSALEVFIYEIQESKDSTLLKITYSDIGSGNYSGISANIQCKLYNKHGNDLRFYNFEKRISLLNKVGRFQTEYQYSYQSGSHNCIINIIELP
jgi:hypothetical protein